MPKASQCPWNHPIVGNGVGGGVLLTLFELEAGPARGLLLGWDVCRADTDYIQGLASAGDPRTLLCGASRCVPLRFWFQMKSARYQHVQQDKLQTGALYWVNTYLSAGEQNEAQVRQNDLTE